MAWVAARMSERGTWAGLGILVSMILGKAFPEAIAAPLTDAGMAVGALLVVIMKEREKA